MLLAPSDYLDARYESLVALKSPWREHLKDRLHEPQKRSSGRTLKVPRYARFLPSMVIVDRSQSKDCMLKTPVSPAATLVFAQLSARRFSVHYQLIENGSQLPMLGLA